MIVVGVDGADVETLVRPALEGDLPNAGALLDAGTYGTLRSVSTSSAAAWSAHLTGVEPSRGGITGFTTGDRFVRTGDLAVRTYPELLADAGLRVGLVNLPITYPPLDLDGGFCVSGQLVPLDADDYATPEAVGEVLADHDYEVDVQYGRRQYAFVDEDLPVSREQLLADVLRVEEKRLAVARELLADFEWDLFFVLVNGTDPVQHCYWHEITDAPLAETAMYDLYLLLDDFLGDVRERYPDEDLVVFSDHGFRADPWGADETTRRRWAAVRRWAGRALPNALRRTRLPQYGMDLLSALASATTDAEGAFHTGDHDPEGVWAAAGPSVADSDDPVDAFFLDLPATILHAMGRPVPAAYPGAVRDDVVATGRAPERRDVDLAVERRVDDRAAAAVEEQLAHLGYVEMVEGDGETAAGGEGAGGTEATSAGGGSRSTDGTDTGPDDADG